MAKMISQTAEYALRAMVALATSRNALTSREIAEDAKVPVDYLAKILRLLARAELVRAQRGRHGGFETARPTNQLTVLEVVSAVDPVQRIKTCPLGLAAHGENLCPLHRAIDDAARSVEEAFRATTIHSLIDHEVCKGAMCDA